ncbi:MAG: alcohol dehydrogenase catalytic domain-containing protein [Candidatus Hydrogenedentes bacterium]|jgi:L-iditol 2-dehydrogenase|nr:alcohol dehydrogenase catalytic domain-containing protein [Candidatus Hydrogenedentota bacterium]
MKAWQWYQKKSMKLVELPRPELGPEEVLIRIEAVGVCGSDIHYYRDGHIGCAVIEEPLVLGHEYAGIVEEVGAKADASLLGKRVAVEPGKPCLNCEFCRTGYYNVCTNMSFPGGPGHDGALCEYMAVDSSACFVVPEDMTSGCAAMVEPAAVAVHTVELAALKPGDTVAVFGLGVIGLLTAQLAKRSGAVRIFGIDPLAYRVDVASRFGVDAALCAKAGGLDSGGKESIAWLEEQTGGRLVDVAIDCTNSAEGLALACAAARPAGRCVLTGISGRDEDYVPVSIARRRGLNLKWCRRFRHSYPASLALIEAGVLDVQGLISHVFPFEQAPEAFDLTTSYKDNVLKASIEW